MNEQFIDELYANRLMLDYFPSSKKAIAFLEHLYHFLFICRTTPQPDKQQLTEDLERIKSQAEELLLEAVPDKQSAGQQVSAFCHALPEIYQNLLADAKAILASDPAAKNVTEILAAYPGFFAMVSHRIAHQFHLQGVPLLPRLLSEYAHSKTGIDIHPGARIGKSFSIDHGTGIVIGETTVIQNNVKIYQGVTLGALSVSKDKANHKRHPTIEDDVVIYSGATILGGETIIGKGSVIGGNVWITYSIPPNSVVYHQSEIRVKDRNPFPEPLNFVI